MAAYLLHDVGHWHPLTLHLVQVERGFLNDFGEAGAAQDVRFHLREAVGGALLDRLRRSGPQ
jgi:hypothetical protein